MAGPTGHGDGRPGPPRLMLAPSALNLLPLGLLATVWQLMCRVGTTGPKILETLRPVEIPHA